MPSSSTSVTSLRIDNEISSDSNLSKIILLETSDNMARQIPAPGAGLQHMRRHRMPTLDDLRVQSDDLRVQYEEIRRLRAEVARLQARRSRNTQVPPEKPKERRRRFSLVSMRG
jgi:hypothetical protein